MQATPIEMSAQQLVLAFLGFYSGPIDGIWSTDSINAMRAFERDDKFCPGVPTNGLPFPARAKLPKGMYWDKKLVNHVKMSPERAAELMKTQQKRSLPVAPEKPVAEKPVAQSKHAQPVVVPEADNAQD